jgi:polyhydroxyalkanoate synthesis regulator phasin
VRQILSLPDDVIKHLHTKDNMSRYITRLVRRDIKSESLEDQVKKIISTMVETGCITQASSGQTAQAFIMRVREHIDNQLMTLIRNRKRNYERMCF